MKELKFLLTAAFFIAAFSITAQAQSLTNTETDPYKREFGFGTNIILNNVFNSESAPLDFMYKWGSGNSYWRVGASTYYSRNNNFDNYSDNFNERFRSNINFGKEWREELGGRWLLNYGMDLFASYSNNETESKNYLNGIANTDDMNVMRQVAQVYGGGIRPFVGIMFKVNQRLYLGTEASFMGEILNNKYERESYQMRDGEKVDENLYEEDSERKSHNFNLRTNPASNIFLYYRF